MQYVNDDIVWLILTALYKIIPYESQIYRAVCQKWNRLIPKIDTDFTIIRQIDQGTDITGGTIDTEKIYILLVNLYIMNGGSNMYNYMLYEDS
jgi:hypothetical protein